MSAADPLPPHPEACARCHRACNVAEFRLALAPDSPHASREFARDALRGESLRSGAIEDVVLVVNELVTASYVVGARGVELRMEAHADHVAVIVRDDRPADWRARAAPNETREMLLDAVTITRDFQLDERGAVNVARVGLRTTAPGSGRYLTVPPSL